MDIPIQSYDQYSKGGDAFKNGFQNAISNMMAIQDAQEKMKQMQLTNQYQQTVNKYADPMQSATLQSVQLQNQYAPLNAQYKQYLMTKGMMGKPTLVKSQSGYYWYNPMTGVSLPLKGDDNKPLMPAQSGLNIQTYPDGTFSIGTDGGQFNQAPQQQNQPQSQPQQVNPIQQQNVPVQQQSSDVPQYIRAPSPVQDQMQQQINPVQPSNNGLPQFVTTPFSPHSSRNPAGSTIIDTKSGQMVSVPTTKTEGTLQTGIINEPATDSLVKDLTKQLGPYIGISSPLKKASGWINQRLGINDPVYNDYLSGKNSTITLAVERFFASNPSLPKTIPTTEAVEQMFTPKWDDTEESYAARMKNVSKNLKLMFNSYNNASSSGISLNPNTGTSNESPMPDVSDEPISADQLAIQEIAKRKGAKNK